MLSIPALCLLVCLVCLSLPSPCISQMVPPPQSCNASDLKSGDDLLKNELIPKLRFLQRILDQNFTIPETPRLQVDHNSTLNSVTISLSNFASFTQSFQVSYYADVGVASLSNSTTFVLNAIKDDNFTFRGSMILSASSNFVPGTRYFFSAIAVANAINLQSSPTPLVQFDYLPSFSVVDTIAAISADSTPLSLDIVTRYFAPGVFITLVMRDRGVHVNVSFTKAPDPGRLPSNVFIARVQVPELFFGGSYQLVFSNPVDKITITRSLQVRPPFRPSLVSVSPSRIPLAGSNVRILLTNVTEPLLAVSTFFSLQSSPAVFFASADSIEASVTGPLDFFVTFRMPNVSLASTVIVLVRPNNNAKAISSFSIVYTAVRLIASLPISYFFPRIGSIRVTIAVDVGVPTVSSVSFTGAAASRHSIVSSRLVTQGVHEYTLQLQASLDVGSYQGTLTISANSQLSDVSFPVVVLNPPAPTIVFDPATIFDDGSSASRVSVTVRDIGDILSANSLTVNCSFASVCVCAVESFSLNFASINCVVRGPPGGIRIDVNNTNTIGYGIHIFGSVVVRPSTTPRVLAVSTNSLSQLGRFPVAVAVTNFLSIDRIRINGVQYNSNSNFYTTMSVVRPFTSDEEFRQIQMVKQLYPLERIFEDALSAVQSRLQNMNNNATILLFRIPKVSNSSIVVEIEQLSPVAIAVVNFAGVALSSSPFISTSVSRVGMQGGTNVVVDLKQYIPITQQSDIDILCLISSNSSVSNISVRPTLVRASITDSVFQFESPTLTSTADFNCAVVSRIDLILGITAPSAPFTLSVFDPRSLTLVDSSQRRFYSSGGPRVLTVNVRFFKGFLVSARANLVFCVIVSSPSLDDSRLNPDAIQSIRIMIPEFPSLVGDVNVEIQSGTETLALTVSLVASPTSPVLLSIQGNTAIPSRTNTVLVTAMFQEFIASTNTSSFMVFVPSLTNFTLPSLNVSSDFQRTIVSFSAPQLLNMPDSQPSVILDAFVADLSSACGRMLSCIGRLTLQYSNINIASFVSMNPSSGSPSVSTLVNVLLTNVQTTNLSLVAVSVGDPQKANVLILVTGASFGGSGISSQTVITFRISWIANTRPMAAVNLALTIVLDKQTVNIPTTFTVLSDNQPQLLSNSPSSISVFGGRHIAVFVQPSAFGFRSASVLIDGATVASNFSTSGDLISFNSPRVSEIRTSSVSFVLVGASLSVTLSSPLSYTAPPAVTVRSVFPSQFSSFGSTSQVQLVDVPSFWSPTSLQTNLIQGASAIPCLVLDFIRSSNGVTVSLSCPASNPGFGNLEIFDVSAVTLVARSLPLPILSPTALQFVSILPSQFFSSKPSLMTLNVRNFPVGLSARIFFLRPAPLLDIPATVLSSYFEPSNTSSTVATIVVNAPSSVNLFAVSVSVTTSSNVMMSATSSFFSVLDDSVSAVISVKPTTLQSIGGSIEVLLSGLPPNLAPANFSATFFLQNALRIATVSSCSYNSDGRAIVVVVFPSVDMASSASVTVSLSPMNFESKAVNFPVNIQNVQPSIGSVTPSVFSSSGGDRLIVRLLYFPVVTLASFVTASIGGISASLSVSLVSSRLDVTVIEVQTSLLNISESGARELIVNYILSPPTSLIATVFVQVTSRAVLVPPTAPVQINFNTTAVIPVTVAFSAVDFRKFDSFPVGSFVNSASITSLGEGICFSIVLTSDQGAPRCSDIGCLLQESGRTNYRILSKNVPFQGCVSFGVQYFASAAPINSTFPSRIQELSVFWSALCATPAQIGIARFSVDRALVTLSPSVGAVSGGYIVSIPLSGITISGEVSVFFGRSMAAITSRTILGSTLVLSVICPASSTASVNDVSIQSGNSILATSKFNYVLGCLDYDNFCSSIQGGYIANILFLKSSPPSASECSISYCIALSSISAPLLVSFPRKQSTSVSTITFSVRNIFALSGSQIRVATGNGNKFLNLLSSNYSSETEVFSLTTESLSLVQSSDSIVWVYSVFTGSNVNVSFVLTSLAPIVGPVKVDSLSPSVVPFEGTASLRLFISNFPYDSLVPDVTFSIIVRYNNLSQNFTVQSSSFHEFGNGSVVFPLQPSSVISLSESRQVTSSFGFVLNVTLQGVGFYVNRSIFVQVGVLPRVNRQILSISAPNSLSPSRFRSVPGTVMSVSVQGFDGPDVTICFGFKSSSPNRNHQSCGESALEQNCFVLRNSVFYGNQFSTLSIPYPRDFFTTLPSSAAVADLTVRVSDFVSVDACNFIVNSRIVDCGTSPNVNCMQIVPSNAPSLQSEPPTFVHFITVQNGGRITGSEIFLTFSNFFASTDTVVARIGSDFGSNAFPRIQDGCTFLSCRISVIVGGNIGDASLVDSADGLTIFVRARNVSLPVKILRIVAPPPAVTPSSVSSSGGSTITVTSYSFSQLSNSAQYSVSNPSFSILRASKVGNFSTVFEIRLMTPLPAGSISLSILSATPRVLEESLILEIFPAVTLSSPVVSECLAGSRRVQILVSNLPRSLDTIDISLIFNAIPRPVVLVSSSLLNFSFPCNENVNSQVPLSIIAVVSGSIRQASTSIIIPPLPLSLSFVVGDSRFPINTSQPIVQASVICSSIEAALSNSRCRAAVVDTELRPGTNLFLDVVPIGSSVPAASLNIFILLSTLGNSLISFVFDPTVDLTPSGIYNLVLTANSRTASTPITVFNPVVSAVCLVPSSCSINSEVGGVVTIMLVNFASAPVLIRDADLDLSVSKLDGVVISSLKPQLTAFSGTENRLTVQINRYVTASDFRNGQMIVLLKIALLSSPSTNVDVRIVLRLGPRVNSVEFTESLASLRISMNQPVISRVSPTNCSSLFANSTVNRFGRNPVCTFSSQSTIDVTFGSGPDIVSGDVLSILPGSIVPFDLFPISNVALFPTVSAIPSAFRRPTVEIRGTQYVEGCSSADPAVISAVASSPRPFASVTWSCPSCSRNAAAPLISFLSSSKRLSITIPADIISISKCQVDSPCGIVVEVVDFGARSSESKPFFIYANQNAVPDLQFVPLDFIRYTSDMTILLRTRFKFSTCFGDTLSVPVFSWSISPPPASNVTSSIPRLFLPPNSLLPGQYQVTVTVLLNGAMVSAEQPLVIYQRPIIASLSAPNFVSSRSNITLDASRSRDLEISNRPSRTLRFTWTCIYENQPCLDSFGRRLLLPFQSVNHPILTIPASTLQLSSRNSQLSDPKFVFEVLVSILNADDLRVDSRSAEVFIVQDAIPTVIVAASSTVLNSGSSIPVGLSAAVLPFNPSVVFVWSEISGLISGGINSVLDPAFKASDPTIVINSTLLVPGRPYVFQAAVANNIRAAGTVSISVNQAPSSGRCFIASVQTGSVLSAACRPADRCSLLSRIRVSCENWMDENLPLRYQIGYQSVSGSESFETRLDYSPDSASTIQMPIGVHNLFIDVCDSNFACSTFTSFSENPIIISSVVLNQAQQDSISKDVTKSVQSGDVDAFSSALSVSISYFRSTQPSNRRLLQSVVTLQTAPNLILDMSLKTVGIGAAVTLSQTLSSLAQASRDFDGASANTVLRALVSLSALLSPASTDESSSRASSSQIDTAARSTANILSSLSNVGAVTSGTNFQNLKRVEANLAAAMLQNAQLNQVFDVSSADKQYSLRATSVRSNAAVSIKAPAPAGSGADFGFSLNVIDGSSVRVLSSFTPKAKYASSVPQGNVLMSDVADCTVTKQKGVNSATIKSGPELGTVSIKIPFALAPSGPGSHAVLSQDRTLVKIAFFDETVSPPVWKYDGCQGTVELVNTVSAIYTGTCSHLTSFGIIVSPPVTIPGQTSGPQPQIPIPLPGSGPGVTAKSTSPPSSEEFPLWAIIFIPVAGGVALLSMGGFFAYRRVVAVRTRAKQIVAASAWKSFANVTTIPKPVASLATSTNPVLNGPDVSSLVAISQNAVVSLPTAPVTPPSVTSKFTETSSTASRRQELADIAAAQVENHVGLPEVSPVMSSLLRVDAARSKLFSSASAQRRDLYSPGAIDLQSTVSSVRQRRQQRAEVMSELSAARASSSQISPTRLPVRLSPASGLSRSPALPPVPSVLTQSTFVRSRSSSRSRSGLASPFFAQPSPETRQLSPRTFQSSASRARSPLPSSLIRSSSGSRTTSPLHASTSPGRFGVTSVERPQSLSPMNATYRAGTSPASSGSRSPVPSAPPRSSSRPGFFPRMPGNSPQQGGVARYDQA
jgi:hypothetical protein